MQPLLGNNAAVIFAVALLFAGIASTITSGMAAGSIFAGIYREPYDIKDSHSRWGVLLSLVMALIIIMLVSNPFMGLIYSQMILSIQLPITIFLQVYLTSSGKVLGKYKNRTSTKWILYILGGIVTVLNVMLFIGLTVHDVDDQVVPGLAESWDYDEDTYTYTFHIRDGIKWHDGEPFTADDVKFTIEAIMDPDNGSENAPNYEDVQEITVTDDQTIAFKLAEPNVAFLEYMTMAILPKHLLDGEDMQESDFFRHPIGTGPYKLESWDAGQSIVMVKNEDYYLGSPKIDKVIFKIVEDDNTQAVQLQSGEIDMALLDPKNAQSFKDTEDYTCYDMTTSDYRGIMFNFGNDYWTENKDIIPAVCYGIDRQAIIDAVLLGQGMPAYGPLQRNIYNDEKVEHYDYNPEKAKEILENAGCTMDDDGFYERNGEEIGFVISVMSGEQDRIDIAQAAAQQLQEIGINCTVDIPAQMDWGGQMACLIGWGSPFDADDHTYKVFGTDKGANYSGYSNEKVDEYLTLARQYEDQETRAKYYDLFQEELAKDPAYAFICYIDANYVADSDIKGISEKTVLGHHGVGIFWNIQEWEIVK